MSVTVKLRIFSRDPGGGGGEGIITDTPIACKQEVGRDGYENNCLVFPEHSPLWHEIHTGNVKGLSLFLSKAGQECSPYLEKKYTGDEHILCSRHTFCVKELGEQILSRALQEPRSGRV